MRPARELGFRINAALFGLLLTIAFATNPARAQESENVAVVYEAPHANGIDSVVFSPDGRQVMSGGRDRALKLWDVASGHLIRSFQQHKRDAYVIAFSPDGSRVISESEDETFKLWDTATGRVIRSYQDQSGVGSTSFAPDGTYFLTQDLITPGGDGVRRWSRKGLRDMLAADNPSGKTTCSGCGIPLPVNGFARLRSNRMSMLPGFPRTAWKSRRLLKTSESPKRQNFRPGR
jgi:WD40 repeat protein